MTPIEDSSSWPGAAVLPARFAFAAPAARKVRLGVVGGNFGTGFFFNEHPNCIVEAVSDLRPERRDALMKVYGCRKSYESLEKMLFDKNVDAVFCATPAPDHLRHVMHDARCRQARAERGSGGGRFAGRLPHAGRSREEVRAQLHDGGDQLLPSGGDLRAPLLSRGKVRPDRLRRSRISSSRPRGIVLRKRAAHLAATVWPPCTTPPTAPPCSPA